MFWFAETAKKPRTCKSVGVGPLFARDESFEVFDEHADPVDLLIDDRVQVLARELFLLQDHDLELGVSDAADERVESGFVGPIGGSVLLVREELMGLLTSTVP